jgi:hypothetical protein
MMVKLTGLCLARHLRTIVVEVARVSIVEAAILGLPRH